MLQKSRVRRAGANRIHPQERLAVHDSAALQKVAEWVRAHWSEDRFLQPKPVHRDLQPDRVTLWRWARRPPSAISVQGLDQLRMAVHRLSDGQERTRLFRLIDRVALEPDARALLDAHARWMQERLGRFMRRRGPRFQVVDRCVTKLVELTDPSTLPPENPLWLSLQYGDPPLIGLPALRDREYHELLARRLSAPCRELLQSFADQVLARGHEPRRVDLAVLRILEPVLEAAEAGFIERSWSELSQEDQVSFVRAGIRRERLLLARKPAPSRAKKIARDGPFDSTE